MIFVKDNKRINVWASHQDEQGNVYPNLASPDLMERFGITVVPDPAPPEDYTTRTYDVREIEDAPYVLYVKRNPELVAREDIQLTNYYSRNYLAETDWYVIRFLETGVPVPADVTQKRQEARAAIQPVPDIVSPTA